jgi:hypothetical protein
MKTTLKNDHPIIIFSNCVNYMAAIDILKRPRNVATVNLMEESRLLQSLGTDYLEILGKNHTLFPDIVGVIKATKEWRSGYLTRIITPILGLVLLIGLTYGFQTQTIPLQKIVTTIIFIGICFFGIIAGTMPSKISGIFRSDPTKTGKDSGFSGHHPNCNHFKDHILVIGRHRLCAGCTGLEVGAFLGIAITLFTYQMTNSPLSEIALWIGIALAMIGMLQHVIDLNNPLIHASLNVALVLGVSLAKLGSEGLNGGFLVATYMIALTLYLVITRIELSQHDHHLTCKGCEVRNGCSYAQ